MQTDYHKQAQDFLDRFKIDFRATLSDSKTAPWRDGQPNHEHGEPHHYRVTLSRPNSVITRRTATQSFNGPKRLTFDFWGSIADMEAGKTEIAPYDVLACISSDSTEYLNFEGWCGDMGYETDSIKALQTYRRCDRFAKRLRAFFTAEELEALAEIR